MTRRFIPVLAALALAGCGTAPADLVLRGGEVITLDPARPRARALAVRDGVVVAAGDDDEIAALVGEDTTVLDLDGAIVMPGIVESHGHFAGLGARQRIVDLRAARSFDEIVDLVARAAADTPSDAWIEGRGWDQNRWTPAELPDRDALDRRLPGRRVLLTRIDGHAVLASGAALEAAGIARGTPDPIGGEILRRADGAPTGVLVDNAVPLVEAAFPAAADAVLRDDLLAAQEEAFRHGITSFHDAGTDWLAVARMRRLMAEGGLKIRLNVMIGGSGTTRLDFGPGDGAPIVDAHDRRLTVRTFKLGVDGALGSRGAALLEDYADRPGHRGLLLLDEDRLVALGRRALAGGWQVAVHAIGDAGNRMVLDAWERLFREMPAGRAARFRVEHAQIVDAADVPRFGALGLVAAVQTCHAASDLPWADERLGAARLDEGGYAWRALLDGGAVLCNGTDCPVEDVDPFANMAAAISGGAGPGSPVAAARAAQRLTREEAVHAATIAGAFAAFEEDVKGRLAPGMLADFIVLDRDPLRCADEDLAGTRVLETWVGGEKVFDALEDVSHGR